jgi:DNA-binding MarR family transcriptional regulator
MSQVARALDVTLPQVTALVTVLIKIKLIKQKVLATDRRGRQVIITPKGNRVLVKLEERIAVAMRAWSQDIPADQLRAYMITVALLSAKSENL